MSRLPTVGGDNNDWGSILNDFLGVEHNADGSQKTLGVTKGGTGATDAATALSNLGAASTSALASKLDSSAIDTDITLGANSDSKIASQKAIKAYVDTTASSGAPDATASSKGIVKLTGDLGGTADSPSVPGLAGKADDSTVVHKAGTETITGAKNYTGGITINGTNIVVASDSRLTDNRTPLDGTVSDTSIVSGGLTNAAISSSAAIAKTKLAALNIVDADVSAISESKITGLTADLAATEKSANKGAASGYAPLDASSQVPLANLPLTNAGQLQGTDVDSSAPSDGQSLVYSQTSDSWVPNTVSSTTVSDATASVKGLIQLAGDLAGTASNPTVPGLSGKVDLSAVTAKGDILAATAANTLSRVGVGADGLVLTASSGASTGLTWSAASGGKNGSSDRIGYVSKSGNDANDGLSWATAKLTIGAANSAGKFIIFIGAGDYVETVTITNLVMLFGTRGGIGYGTNIVAPSPTANCIEMMGNQSTVMNIGTRGSGTTWTGAGVYVHGNQNAVINHSHINYDNTATKDFGGIGIYCLHGEGNTIINGTYHECQVGMKWGRECASSTFFNIATSLCYCDFWCDGSDDGSSGGMPQGNTVIKFKGVACKSTTSDATQVGTPYGYAWLMDQSATGLDATTDCSFIYVDLDETNQSGFPFCQGLVYTENSTFIGVTTSPEMVLTLSGKHNSFHSFYNQYHLTLSGSTNYVHDFNNVGSLQPAVFSVTGTDNRIEGLYNNTSGGCSYSIASGNYFVPQTRNIQTLTYGTSIATDSSLASVGKLSVTNNSPFTIAAPTHAYEGWSLTYDISNNSGGAMGNVTWSPAFKLDSTGFVKPANGYRKLIKFKYSGTHWIQDGPTTGDIAIDQAANLGTPVEVGTTNENSSSTTHTITLSAAVEAGDLIGICSSDLSSSVTAVSATDSKSNTYTLAAQRHASNTGTSNGAMFYAIATNALSIGDTITVTYSAAVAPVMLIAFKASGISTASPLDKTATSVQDSGATFTGAPALTTGTLSQADELIVAMYVASASPGGLPATPATNFTLLDSMLWTAGNAYLVVQYRIVSSTSSVSTPITFSGSQSAGWAGLVATFAAAT